MVLPMKGIFVIVLFVHIISIWMLCWHFKPQIIFAPALVAAELYQNHRYDNSQSTTIKKPNHVKVKTNLIPKKMVGAATITQRATVTPNNDLALQLHDLLQQQIYIPAGMQQLRNNYVTTLEFWLNPDGQLHDIKIAVSSGLIILDNIALNAANTISPVTLATKIAVTIQFRVQVLFKTEG